MNLKVPVSVVLATRNEEKNIEECLQSVEWAEQVIVIDGSSEDDTVSIAKRYTSDVFVEPASSCEEQRLKGLERVSCDWFFLLDADERVSDELRKQIEDVVLKGGSFSAYHFMRRNYLDVSRPVHFGHPDFQLRLFKKVDLLELPEKIHRSPKVRGEIGKLNGELVHFFFESISHYIHKINFYTELEADYCLKDPEFKLSFIRLFIKPWARFFQNYFLKKAFLDGYWGLVFSFGSMYYEMLVNLRILLGKKSKNTVIARK